jgi:hypothetical protein
LLQDEDDDALDEEDEDDYYAQPVNLEAKSSKLATTTEFPTEETTVRGWNDDTTIKIFTQKTQNQKQVTALINPDKNVRLVQTQNGRTIKYPPSFETKGEPSQRKAEILAKKSESLENLDTDMSISKTAQKIKYKTRYLPSKPSNNALKTEDDKQNSKPDSYVSVTNSLSGSLSESNQQDGKFASTYFTKSSTCGHFTFSCNIVYGSEGRSRICRPKQTNQKC